MKRLISTILVIPLSGLALAGSQSFDDKDVRYFDQHWQNAGYHQKPYEKTFSCWDAWGETIRGKFSKSDKYLIELAGGQCVRSRYDRPVYDYRADLSTITETYFPINNVYRAANKIRKNYGLKRGRLLKATRVKDSYKWFKYTLVFETRHGLRKFRVKHKHWNAEIADIKEV